MAHFAELDSTNHVVRVISVYDNELLDERGNESEQKGIEYCVNLLGGRWVQTSIDKKFRVNFAQEGMLYLPDKDAFVEKKPSPYYELGDDFTWVRPDNVNEYTGLPFTHEELAYLSYYIRNTKSYRFCPAVYKDPENEFQYLACTTKDFMYPTFEEVMYGYNRTIIATGARVEGQTIIVPAVHSLRKEIDLTPLGLILKVTWEILNIEVASDALNSHPQTAARTPHELFRLIIEWALAHTEFGNNEPAAVTCHKVLQELQMPIEVREELLEQVEPQAVERYLKGEYPFKGTSFEVLEDPPMPPLFEAWYQETRLKYRELNVGDALTVNLDSLPESYPQ
jgi:hypothetical protein